MTVVLAGFFASPTVQTALVVGGIVAAVTAVVGVFTAVRAQAFAGHALADLGAVGGSGAFLIGVSQLWGFVVASVIAAVVIELIGIRRLRARDITTGVVFAAGLGLTALFLYWDTTIGSSSNAAVSVLFGSLFVIDPSIVPVVGVLGTTAILIVVALWRWLLLTAVHPDLAAAQGIPVRLTGLLFAVALAIAVALSALSIGAILSTALLIGPAATALAVSDRFGRTALLAAVTGVAETWAGCLLSYASASWTGAGGNWPVSSCIVGIILVVYLAARAAKPVPINRVVGVR
jgi:zinc/manganese transport system permease protein